MVHRERSSGTIAQNAVSLSRLMIRTRYLHSVFITQPADYDWENPEAISVRACEASAAAVPVCSCARWRDFFSLSLWVSSSRPRPLSSVSLIQFLPPLTPFQTFSPVPSSPFNDAFISRLRPVLNGASRGHVSEIANWMCCGVAVM